MDIQALEQGIFAAISHDQSIAPEARDAGRQAYIQLFTQPALLLTFLQYFDKLTQETSRVAALRACKYWLKERYGELPADAVGAFRERLFGGFVPACNDWPEELAGELAEAQAVLVMNLFPEQWTGFWGEWFTKQASANCGKRFLLEYAKALAVITPLNVERVIHLKEVMKGSELVTNLVGLVAASMKSGDVIAFRSAWALVEWIGPGWLQGEPGACLIAGLGSESTAASCLECIQHIIRKVGDDQKLQLAGSLCPLDKLSAVAREYNQNSVIMSALVKLVNEIGCLCPELAQFALEQVASAGPAHVVHMTDFLRNFVQIAGQIDGGVATLVGSVLKQMEMIMASPSFETNFEEDVRLLEDLASVIGACFLRENFREAVFGVILQALKEIHAPSDMGALSVVFRAIYSSVACMTIPNEAEILTPFAKLMEQPPANYSHLISCMFFLELVLRVPDRFSGDVRCAVLQSVLRIVRENLGPQWVIALFEQKMSALAKTFKSIPNVVSSEIVQEMVMNCDKPDVILAGGILVSQLPTVQVVATQLLDAIEPQLQAQSREAVLRVLKFFEAFDAKNLERMGLSQRGIAIFQQLEPVVVADETLLGAYIEASYSILGSAAVDLIVRLTERIQGIDLVARVFKVLVAAQTMCRALPAIMVSYQKVLALFTPLIEATVRDLLILDLKFSQTNRDVSLKYGLIVKYLSLLGTVARFASRNPQHINQEMMNQAINMLQYLMDRKYDSVLILRECIFVLTCLLDGPQFCDTTTQLFTARSLNFLMAANFAPSQALWKDLIKTVFGFHQKLRMKHPMFMELFKQTIARYGQGEEWINAYFQCSEIAAALKPERLRDLMQQILDSSRRL